MQWENVWFLLLVLVLRVLNIGLWLFHDYMVYVERNEICGGK